MKLYLIIGLGLILVGLGLMVVRQWPSQEPKIVICDVGQGDGAVISQGFTQVVIDTGRNDGQMVECLSQVLPFWDKRLEMVIISHEDGDHAGGLGDINEHYQIERVVTTPAAAAKIHVPETTQLTTVAADQKINWGQCEAEIVWPGAERVATETNDSSLVMRTECAGVGSMWWAGDAGEKVEQELLVQGKVRQTAKLKVAHHGSANATGKPFLEILQPSQAIISVGKNRYGHPSPETLKRLKEEQIAVVRTDQVGLIYLRP